MAGPCSGMRCGERVVDVVDAGELAGLLLVPLAVPALQLAGDVALVAAEVGQADGVEVDGVDGGQRVDERLAGVAGGPPA